VIRNIIRKLKKLNKFCETLVYSYLNILNSKYTHSGELDANRLDVFKYLYDISFTTDRDFDVEEFDYYEELLKKKAITTCQITKLKRTNIHI